MIISMLTIKSVLFTATDNGGGSSKKSTQICKILNQFIKAEIHNRNDFLDTR